MKRLKMMRALSFRFIVKADIRSFQLLCATCHKQSYTSAPHFTSAATLSLLSKGIHTQTKPNQIKSNQNKTQSQRAGQERTAASRRRGALLSLGRSTKRPAEFPATGVTSPADHQSQRCLVVAVVTRERRPARDLTKNRQLCQV